MGQGLSSQSVTSKPEPWFEIALISSTPVFDQELQVNRIIFVDEDLFSSNWDLMQLRQGPRSGLPAEDLENFVVTYSSDTKYCIRTLISKDIFKEPDDDEPPLTYSDLGPPANTTTSNAVTAGHRKCGLLISRYEFKKHYDDTSQMTLSLIVKAASTLTNETPAPKEYPDYFRRLWIESHRIYTHLQKVYHSDISSSWEICGTKILDPEAAIRDVKMENGTEQVENIGNASQLLSALLVEDDNSEPLNTSTRQLKKKRPRLESDMSDSDQYAESYTRSSSDDVETVMARNCGVQTNPKRTKWSITNGHAMETRSNSVREGAQQIPMVQLDSQSNDEDRIDIDNQGNRTTKSVPKPSTRNHMKRSGPSSELKKALAEFKLPAELKKKIWTRGSNEGGQ